jgi:hypothetical protein
LNSNTCIPERLQDDAGAAARVQLPCAVTASSRASALAAPPQTTTQKNFDDAQTQ